MPPSRRKASTPPKDARPREVGALGKKACPPQTIASLVKFMREIGDMHYGTGDMFYNKADALEAGEDP